MAKVVPGRFTADVDGDFVVFLIGMRVNKPLRVRKWFPVAMAMPRMLRWLEKNPQAGLLGYNAGGSPRAPMLVQYWRSFEDLERFAKQLEAPHVGPWRRFAKEIGDSGDVGHLARDVQGPGRRVRSCLREHADLGPRERNGARLGGQAWGVSGTSHRRSPGRRRAAGLS